MFTAIKKLRGRTANCIITFQKNYNFYFGLVLMKLWGNPKYITVDIDYDAKKIRFTPSQEEAKDSFKITASRFHSNIVSEFVIQTYYPNPYPKLFFRIPQMQVKPNEPIVIDL